MGELYPDGPQQIPRDFDWGEKPKKKRNFLRFGAAALVASGAMLFFGQTVAGAPNKLTQKDAAVEHKFVAKSNMETRLKAVRWLSNLAIKEKKKIWAMEDVMQQPHTRIIERHTTALSIPAKKQELANWRQIKAGVNEEYLNPPHLEELLCIHKGEASWKNPGIDWRGRPSIYYGGVQMDKVFMQRYAPEIYSTKGTADHWPIIEQIWVAERAIKTQGNFGPWPNTAKACGLPTSGHII